MATSERIVDENGDIYEGETHEGVPHGTGIYEFGDGSGQRYAGQFMNGAFHGAGAMRGPGASYEGQWHQAARHGSGTLERTLGDGTTTRYAGEWRNNKKHGKGEWTDAEGSYHGVWGDGNLTHKECRAIMVQSFGGPEVLQMGTKAIPEPQEAQIQIHLAASGVNPSDTYQRLGPLGPWAAMPHLLPQIPFTPGKDGAGVVTAVGPGCSSGLQVGDRVYCAGALTGTMAEYCVCNERTVYPLPAAMSFEQGACVGVPCATAYRALLQRGGATNGECVFIHGASGAVGLAATQLARAEGCFVVGSAGSEAGVEAVKTAGANAVVNHRQEGYLEEAKAALRAAEGQPSGFALVLEMTGTW